MTLRWRAPGRVNLIGEHTDYNDGFVLPFAIDPSCVATVSSAEGTRVQVRSVQRAADATFAADRLRPGLDSTGVSWAGYAVGPVWALRQRGHDIGGLDIEVDSGVPVGSGLSSSAALVCSVTAAIADLHNLDLSDDEMLAVTRSVENDFVGAPTGGMDQLAALRCTVGHALFCDMRALVTEQVPLPLATAGMTILVLDSRAEHRHSDGEYGRRRQGCERAAALLGVPALRDVPVDELDAALGRLPEDELRRYTRHVVTENERVLRTAELLRSGAVDEIGPLLTASHASMRDDYRITIPEIDIAVAGLMQSGALGARMTGGGFGGCVIALIAPAHVEAAVAAVRREYARQGFREPGAFTVVRPAGGAHRL